MDIRDFNASGRDIVARLAPRIDPEQARFIEEDAGAGEWENALTNLAASLIRHRVPISRSDRDDLTRLLDELGTGSRYSARLTIDDSSEP